MKDFYDLWRLSQDFDFNSGHMLAVGPNGALALSKAINLALPMHEGQCGLPGGVEAHHIDLRDYREIARAGWAKYEAQQFIRFMRGRGASDEAILREIGSDPVSDNDSPYRQEIREAAMQLPAIHPGQPKEVRC